MSPSEITTVPALLAERAAAAPDSPVLVWRDFDGGRRSWAYGEMERDVGALAGGLRRQGVVAGERVCIIGDNAPELLLSLLALTHLGAVAVTVNARSAPAELRYYLDASSCTGILCSAALLPVVEAARGQRWVSCWDGADPRAPAVPWSRLAEGPSVEAASSRGSTPAGIQFTSGTTSRPKGVVWTHANYIWGARVSAAHERLEPHDRHLTYLPLFHTNAQIYSVMASLWAGAAVVLQPRFSASRFWDVAIEERTTWASMIPFAIKALRSREVPRHHFRRWGTSIVVPSWEARYGVPCTGWWGMTETVTHGIVSDPDRPSKAMGIGYAAPEYEVRVLSGDGAPSEPGVAGDLEIRGERGVSMFLEYLDDPTATAEGWTPDGWFRTGDRVTCDADGWMTFVDRAKDVLKVGGENVAPSEIERVALTVRGVRDAAVVGVPHELLGEVPLAFVVVADGADEDDVVHSLMEACREELASFKVPAEVRVVADLPRSTLEKVSRAELRRQAIEGAPSPAATGASM